MDFSAAAAMDSWLLAFLVLAVFAGGLVKGVCGLGLPIVAMGLLTMVFPVPFALAAACGSIVLANFWQAWAAGAPMAAVKRHWAVIVFLAGFLFAGARLAAHLTPEDLFLTVGVIVALFCALNLWNADLALPARWERAAAPAAGAAAGIMAGVSAIWGPPITMYFLSLRLPKEEFVRAVGLVWACGSVPLVIAYEINGILTPETRALTVLAAPAALAGMFLGARVRARLPQETFRKILLAVFMAVGVNLIRKGLAGA